MNKIWSILINTLCQNEKYMYRYIWSVLGKIYKCQFSWLTVVVQNFYIIYIYKDALVQT